MPRQELSKGFEIISIRLISNKIFNIYNLLIYRLDSVSIPRIKTDAVFKLPIRAIFISDELQILIKIIVSLFNKIHICRRF